MNKKLFTAFSFIFFLFIALGNSKVSAAEIYTSPGDSKFTATKIE